MSEHRHRHRKGKGKRVYLIAGALVLFIAAGAFMFEYFSRTYQIQRDAKYNRELRDEVVNDSAVSDDSVDYNEFVNNDSDSDSGSDKYVSPIDFKKLKKKNSDSIAWLLIPDTEMSFPIMHREGDNTYYLKRNFKKEYSIYGAAYIEDYNNSDMNDIVTVVYGHDISNGEWFGELQTIFTDKKQFERSRNMKLYLPDEERVYRVFAAVPYSSAHLLATYDFTEKKDYNTFINKVVASRSVNAVIDKDEIPEAGTRLLILSTCLKGDYSHRFLVLAYQCQ